MTAARQSTHRVVEVAADDPATVNRDQLIDSCQGLVRSLAWKIHQKLTSSPQRVELDDLIAYGTVGLTQAAKDFDPNRGYRFITYAHHRIRGAILDGLSQMSWFSRQDYHRSRYERMANELLALQNEEGIDDGSRGSNDESRWLSDVSGSLMVVYLASDEDGRSPSATLEDDGDQPADQSIGAELKKKLHELIDQLPAEAGSLIRATYFEGMTLQEAGQNLGISKAWASRLHAKTLDRLAHSLRMAGVAD